VLSSQNLDSRQIIEVDRTRQAAREQSLPSWTVARRDPARRYIAVAGNIGAGKSTLVEFLCHRYDIQPFFEPNEENPYLEDFYRDMKKWSFASQIYFLTAKFRLHLELDATEFNVIQDRTIWEDAEIFAENLYRTGKMDDRDYGTYRRLYDSVKTQIQPPDLMIYLRCPVKAVRKRIRSRGREMEQNIPVAYLRRLHKLYEGWIADYQLSPLLIVPSHNLDYVTDLVDCHSILTTIEKYL
jgi:deoxyadenosine/deoxycytidine kinase